MFPYRMDWKPPSHSPAIFCAHSNRWWTHGELEDAVSGFAKALSSATRGLVFHFIRNRAEDVIAYLAALRAGHAVALLDPTQDNGSVRRLISRYRPEWLIAPALDDSALPSDGSYRVVENPHPEVTTWFMEGKPVGKPLHADVSILLSTSGSTGSPKLVRLSLDNVVSNADGIFKALGLSVSDRAVGHLAFHYSFGLSVLHTHLRAGGSLVALESQVMEGDFWKTVRTHECTFFYGVPYHYEMVRRLNLDRLNVPTISKCAQAGGKVSEELVADFSESLKVRGGQFFVMYGQTEASPRMTTLPPAALPEKGASVGLPLEGSRIEIVDERGNVLPHGETGSVNYYGPNVMLGYAENREDLGEGDLLGHRLQTGDLGYLDADGYLYITGRVKRIGKIFGLRISLDEVEQLASRDARIVAAEADDQLVIFLEECESDRADAVLGHLCKSLKVHPSALRVSIVPSFPLRTNGKIDYQRLKELL